MRNWLLLLALLNTLGLGSTWAAAESADSTLHLRWLSANGKVIATRTLALADLDAMDQQNIETSTPWSDGVHTFTGPSLAAIATLEDSVTAQIHLTALNDYSADIPATDFEDHDPVLSTRYDGKPMRIRDKGPFWIMYPIDSDPVLAQQVYYSRMVWQVRSIDFIAD